MLELKIVHDSDCHNPREDDNLGILLTTLLNESKQYQGKVHATVNFSLVDNIVLPVYKYEHSGIALSTTPFNCRWDSGMIGWVYVEKDTIRKEYNVKKISSKLRTQIENILKSEVDEYSEWLNGECYGWQIWKEDELVDSCYGYIGYDYCKDVGEDTLKTYQKQ